jgi:hypothetical protein
VASRSYGAARLQAVLASLPSEVDPSGLLAAVRADVSRFVGDAEPSDDLTLLCVRWAGADASAGLTEDVLADVDLDAPVAGLGDVVGRRD